MLSDFTASEAIALFVKDIVNFKGVFALTSAVVSFTPPPTTRQPSLDASWGLLLAYN
jgi:hypothetical protein